MPGVLLCCLAHQALKGVPWMGSSCSSGHQAFDGPAFVFFSCRCWHVGRQAMVVAPPGTQDSAVSPCFSGCLAFLHQHFPPRSLPSHPLDPSLHSHQQPSPWDCSTIPKLSSQLLPLPEDHRPSPGYVWLWQGL